MINFGSGDLSTELELEKKEISNIGDIEATLIIKNGTDEKKKYHFATGCQHAFKIKQNGVKVFYSEENQGCTLATSSFELAKNESKAFSFSNYIDVELEEGNYTIKAYLIGYENKVFATGNFSVK
ncbi:MAG: BsuPI-related putative proteinase inhibitor [Balneola sp.]